MHANTQVIAIGGFGCNIGRLLSKRDKTIRVFATDTVTENLSGFENVYKFKNAGRGNGRVATANMSAMNTEIPSIIASMSDVKYNIIVASLSGGTGQSLAPMLIKEMIDQDPAKHYYVFAVVGSEMLADMSSALNTIARYQKLAQMTGNLSISIYINQPGKSFDLLNKAVVEEIDLLTMILSGEFNSPDDGDLDTWICPSRLKAGADLKDTLMCLEITPNTSEVEAYGDVASMITTFKNRDRVPMKVCPVFNLQASIPDTLIPATETKPIGPMHYVQRHAYIQEIIDQVKKMIEDAD